MIGGGGAEVDLEPLRVAERADDQRVPVLPSTAAEAGVPAFSVEEAVAGLPCESRGSAAAAVPDSPVTATVAAIVTAETAAASSRLGPRRDGADGHGSPASMGGRGRVRRRMRSAFDGIALLSPPLDRNVTA